MDPSEEWPGSYRGRQGGLQVLVWTIFEVCGRYETTLDAYETDRDHAHLLVSYSPKVALSKLVMSLKTISSMWVRERDWPEVARALWGEHFWSPSYCVVSAGGAPLDV